MDGTRPLFGAEAGAAPLADKGVGSIGGLVRTPGFHVVWHLPFLVYLFLYCFYTYLFLSIPGVCIWLTVVFALLALACFAFRAAGRVVLPLGLNLLPALGLAVFLGLYTYDQYAIFPRFYENARTYTNVVPSEPSAAVADAGKLVFSSETIVDASQSVSYVREDGSKYCVAPIRDGSGITSMQFWAAGIGCCSDAGAFTCDESGNPAAHSGIVIFDNNGYFAKSRFEFYELARKKAEAEHSLQSVGTPLYVRFVKEDNLDMLSNQYRNSAALCVVFFSLAVWVVLGFLASLFVSKLRYTSLAA